MITVPFRGLRIGRTYPKALEIDLEELLEIVTRHPGEEALILAAPPRFAITPTYEVGTTSGSTEMLAELYDHGFTPEVEGPAGHAPERAVVGVDPFVLGGPVQVSVNGKPLGNANDVQIRGFEIHQAFADASRAFGVSALSAEAAAASIRAYGRRSGKNFGKLTGLTD